MERRLILMRHAESVWASMQGSDHARTLSGQGRLDAQTIAKALVTRSWVPQHVLSSDATRTEETWQAINTEETWQAVKGDHGTEVEARFTKELYLAGLEELWTESHLVEESVDTLLVLGHNPGWSRALHVLSGDDEVLTPASAALLLGRGESWPSALRGRWTLETILRP